MGSGTNHLKSNTFSKREGDMLGRKSWPKTNSGGSPVPRDVQDMTLDVTKISDHGINGGSINNLCSADSMLCDSPTATNDGGYNIYSLNNIPDAENNLSFMNNGDKESNDLFCGWGDMGNFDDVDNMLRSCDSTFGVDSIDNEDDLCWFSSSQPNEDTGATMTDDIKPDTVSGNQRTPLSQIEDFLNNSECNYAVEDKDVYDIMGGSAQGNTSENLYDTNLLDKDIMMLDKEINLEKKQTDIGGKSDAYTNQYYPSSTFQQTGVPYTQFNCGQPSDQISGCESNSGIKAENKTNRSSASNESYTSNHAQSVDSVEKRVDLHPWQDLPPFAATTRTTSKRNHVVFPDAAPILKTGIENDQRKAAAKLETSNMQETSCVSSVVDEVSLEATSFRQLQQVVEQLDVRTKLCIRDSLHRLARSAEQRHNCMNPNGGNRQMKGACSDLETGETDKYVGFMDIETDTNPIDRSIAHLLFHRPSDSSLSSDHDVLSLQNSSNDSSA